MDTDGIREEEVAGGGVREEMKGTGRGEMRGRRGSFFFFRVSSYQIRSLTRSVGAMLWSMARLRRCQLLCNGQLLMMWSAVCYGSPHSHAALSANPHFFMDALYRPTPVRSRFRVVHCFRLRSSLLTPSPGSDT